MSINLMALAWQTALPINHKAALLAMADWANDEGASLHPSIYAVALEPAGSALVRLAKTKASI